jgi:outer membrane lipoprotein-sorting protein
MRTPIVFTVVLFLAAPALAADAAFEAKLQAIDVGAAKVQDFSAAFEQRKHTALLRKPLVSTGTMKVLGSTMRWDTAAPEPSVMHADGQNLRMYYPKQKLLEVYPAQGPFRDLMTSPVPRLASLRKNFTLEPLPLDEMKDDAGDLMNSPDRVAVKLTPTDPFLQKHVGQVSVLLDTKQAIMVCIVVADPDGDRTVIRLSDVKLNAGLKPEDLALAVPAGVKVSKPMDAAQP